MCIRSRVAHDDIAHIYIYICTLATVVCFAKSMDALQLAVPQPAPAKAKALLDPKVSQQLLAHGSTKAAVVSLLTTLAKSGLLVCGDDLDETSLKRQLGEAGANHSNTMTPYGPIVQTIELGLEGLRHWEYQNPFAWLYQMCKVSPGFASIMAEISASGNPVRIIIFADGLVPGNPFRPEKSRSLMCIYWAIVDWPQWLLQRSFAWPLFGIIRETFFEQMEAGLSQLIRSVLRIFFAEVGHSFSRGVIVPGPAGDMLITGIFVGFLADLVGHKELTCWKGHGGVHCCFECDNVINLRVPKGNEVSISCWKPSLFKKRTNQQIWDMVDELARLKPIMERNKQKGCWKELAIVYGYNHEPQGLLSDRGLRSIYQPANHCIRDYMHTLGQDGVANTHIANVLHTLKDECNIDTDRVTEFAQNCNYPSNWGKLEKNAFAKNRLRSQTITSFASTILTMIPVLHMFLEVFIAPRISEHIEAFTLLHHIVGLLRLGPETAMQHTTTLTKLMSRHLEKVVKLYGSNVKPKAHHFFHVVDGMLWVGKLLSCFVTERKHRIIKKAALYIFRHIEHTVLTDIVNTSFEQVAEGHDLYKAVFLVNPSPMLLRGQAFHTSRSAVLPIGLVSKGDVVITSEGIVGKVASFWQANAVGPVYASISAYKCIDGDTRLRATDNPLDIVCDAREVVDALIWFWQSPAIMRVSIPPALLYA